VDTPGVAPAAPDPEEAETVSAAGAEPTATPTEVAGQGAEPAEPGVAEPGVAEPGVAAATLGDEPAVAAAGSTTVPKPRGRLGRIRSVFRLPRSRRGLFALLLVGGGFAAATIFSGAALISWTETADFCGRCHQMGAELAAYEAGPHRDVACGECHVEPGVGGWIKAKFNGTKQLIQVITGLYPKPVPPPDHSALPSVDDTCKKCHSPDRFALSTLTTRTLFSEDEPNSRQAVALMIRPGGGDPYDVQRSVHWHVLRDVEYYAPKDDNQIIDLVEIREVDGVTEQFISQPRIGTVEDVAPDIETIKAADASRRMDCIDCHNRVGHPIPNPRRGTDQSMSSGLIDDTLPYVKRESMRILWAGYPSVEVADQAADGLADFYELNYPDVYASKTAAIDRAVAQLKVLYRLTATPEMKVTAATYPDNLGHTDFPGCFRCHDGGHFLVVDGAVTKEVIPSTCDTCHTFPQIGGEVASLPLGRPPVTHTDTLWVFNHKNVASSVDPGGTSCGECHARDYCASCHNTGAIDVTHDDMATNHAEVIREAPNGAASCTYCHQPVYCARCHSEPVMPASGPYAASANGLPGHVPLAPDSGAPSPEPATGAASLEPDPTPGLSFPLFVGGAQP
jgi:nitrate/TMAO reductase-like tetraheme cytochrome c subunit